MSTPAAEPTWHYLDGDRPACAATRQGPELCTTVPAMVTCRPCKARLPDAALVPMEWALITAALEDAAEARTERAAAECVDCATSGDGRCDTHRDDLARAGQYRALAERLLPRAVPAPRPASAT